MHYVYSFLLWAMCFFPLGVLASAGIPGGGIWFSKDPFFAGDEITIYTLVFNASSQPVKGELEFLDADALLGRKNVELAPGEHKTVGYVTTVSEGKRAFRVRIAGGDFTDGDGDPLQLKNTKASEGGFVVQTQQVLRTVLKDTDKDGVPDASDIDIDGDGLANEKEKAIGTNSYLADTDGDGILDGTDQNPTVRDALPSVTETVKIADKDALASTLEKVLPGKVVEPIVSITTPVIGSIEGFRVSQANKNNERIVSRVDSIVEKVGSGQIVASTSATATLPQLAGKPSPWHLLWRGVVDVSLVRSPFDYAILFFSLLYHILMTYVWIFYVALAIVVVKIIILAKNFLFHREA